MIPGLCNLLNNIIWCQFKILRPQIWKQIVLQRREVSTKPAFSHIILCYSNLPDTWTSGGGFIRVATALSESSSIHSEALYNLTKDMPTIGLEPMAYSILEAKPFIEELWAEEMQSLLQPVSWQIMFKVNHSVVCKRRYTENWYACTKVKIIHLNAVENWTEDIYHILLPYLRSWQHFIERFLLVTAT